MSISDLILSMKLSRPARGAWVEMLRAVYILSTSDGRAPQGARGLKFFEHHQQKEAVLSRPARGAWVEINFEGGA